MHPHPSRLLREPPAIKKSNGSGYDALSESLVGSLIGSVVLAGVLDLFDCLFYYWRNLVIPLSVNCAGSLVTIPFGV